MALSTTILAAGCSLTEPETSDTAQPIASYEGKFEFALDAPWRVERPKCLIGPSCITPPYAIPIQVSLHDVNIMSSDGGSYTNDGYHYWVSSDAGKLGAFQRIEVEERYAGITTIRSYSMYDLHEIELTYGSWPWPTTLPEPWSYVCRIWRGDTCDWRAGALGDNSEWHAILFYTPRETQPNARVELRLRLFANRVDADPLQAVLPATFPLQLEPSTQAVLENSVSVLLARDPLPRFDNRWAYGDLHYHSQGTDNEGESAYAYRGVVQGARALGLDFVFATDHASNSEQLVDIDQNAAGLDVDSTFSGLRDNSPGRYGHSEMWVNSPYGANAEVFSLDNTSTNPRPTQVFLGGEVDVIPEVSDAEQALHHMHYGNGLVYKYTDACGDLPWDVKAVYGTCAQPGAPNYVEAHDRLDVPLAPNHWGIKDPQGLVTWDYFARQHLISLPRDPVLTGFVSSGTSKYGGGTRRLSELIASSYEDPRLNPEAFFFLAHPMARDSGSGTDRLGPDILPYTQIQLDTAFATRHFLGLQLWNEDVRFQTDMKDREHGDVAYPDQPPSQCGQGDDFAYTGNAWLQPWVDGHAHTWGSPLNNSPLFSALHHGGFVWDKLLRMGLDPARTAPLTWLGGSGIRKIFMAGGSDSHGDFNYRRHGGISGTSSVSDTAIGKPRNLVFGGTPAGQPLGVSKIPPFTQQQIVGGLAQGTFSITDGPAVRIAIDMNGNNVIDDADLPMGSIADYPVQGAIPVLVEWKSTDEFGELSTIELYVGGFSDVNKAGATYAPIAHGVRTNTDPPTSIASTFVVGGHTYNRLADNYIMDPAPTSPNALEFTGSGLAGTRRFLIDPAAFPIPVDDPSSFTNPLTPDRLYVRAFMKTKATHTCSAQHTDCIGRMAFTNPVWARKPVRK